MKIKKLKKLKTNLNYRKKYRNLKKDYEELDLENTKLQIEVDRLEWLLDKDTQAQRLKDQQITIDHLNDVKHKLRAEIIELKERGKK